MFHPYRVSIYHLWAFFHERAVQILGGTDCVGTLDVGPHSMDMDESEEESFKLFQDQFFKRYPGHESFLREFLSFEFIGGLTLTYSLRDIRRELIRDLGHMRRLFGDLANRYRNLIQVGRTHGVHAEVTSFGYRFLIAYMDIYTEVNTLKQYGRKSKNLWFDDHHMFGEDFLRKLARSLCLKMGAAPINPFLLLNSHMLVMNNVAQLFNKVALDLLLLGRYGVNEILLSCGDELRLREIQFLSSQLSALVISSGDFLFSLAADTRRARILLHRAMGLLREIFINLYHVLLNLQVNGDAIDHNLSIRGDYIYSQVLLLYLIRNRGMSRPEAAKMIQDAINSGGEVSLIWYLRDKLNVDDESISELINGGTQLKNLMVVFDRYLS